MKRLFLIVVAALLTSAVHSQSDNINFSRYAGRYEANGFVIQIVARGHELLLAVPGAPLQPLSLVERHTFRSETFGDERFVFGEENSKIVSMTSRGAAHSMDFKKVSDTPDDFNLGDSGLSLRHFTPHFIFIYSPTDVNTIEKIAFILEQSYDRILRDFRLSAIPITTVRIYPTAESFHQGINFPQAPSNILATAFGKDDFRMLSPNMTATDSVELFRHVIHEFTHCVHLNISYSPNNPRWLWEGVAMFESGWFADPNSIDVIKNKTNPAFSALTNGLEYELGYVIVEAIKEIWGFDAIVELIKNRGDVRAVLKIDQQEFESRIYGRVYRKYIR